MAIVPGLDLNVKGKQDQIPLRWTGENDHISIVTLLRKHGAKE